MLTAKSTMTLALHRIITVAVYAIVGPGVGHGGQAIEDIKHAGFEGPRGHQCRGR